MYYGRYSVSAVIYGIPTDTKFRSLIHTIEIRQVSYRLMFMPRLSSDPLQHFEEEGDEFNSTTKIKSKTKFQ